MINKTDDDQKDDWNDAKRSINNTKEENEKLVRCHMAAVVIIIGNKKIDLTYRSKMTARSPPSTLYKHSCILQPITPAATENCAPLLASASMAIF